jgi:hypothetical protein
MPYSVSWLVQDRVILTRFHGIVTEQDLIEWLTVQPEMVKSGTPLVHHISYSLEIERWQLSIASLKKLVQGFKKNEDFGWHVEVTSNPMGKMFGSFATQFAGIRMKYADSLEEAVEFLKGLDITLEEAKWEQIP